jgi:competence protein ComEA
MENENFSQDVSGFLSRLKPHFLAISIACIGLLLIGYGMITYLFHQSASNDISFETQKEESSSVKNQDPEIVVDIEGSVQKPGVYHLKNDSRVTDAITAAGGFSADADKQQTQHSLNLAAKLTDGMKLYIPKLGESVQQNSSPATLSVAEASTTGLISINSATAAELDSLPGVGKVTADKIITNRPYSSLEDLLQKKVVSSAVFEKIKEKISL